jgi:hypothetical protein
MKIIPHPALLKEKEAQLEKMHDEISAKECRLYTDEIMLKIAIEKVSKEKKRIILSKTYFFLLGVALGSFISFLTISSIQSQGLLP